MAKYRMVDTKIWEDNYVLELDPSEKLLFVYLLTNSRTSIAGIYEINLRKVSMETGFDKEMIMKILERFARDDKAYFVEGFIVLRNFIKYQRLNPSILKGIALELEKLPDRLRKFILIDDTGLFLDARELGGDLSMLSDKIDSLYIRNMQSDPSLGTGSPQSPSNLNLKDKEKDNINSNAQNEHKSYPHSGENRSLAGDKQSLARRRSM